MGEPSLFDKMISHLRATSKYYTGYPKDLGPSRVIHFTSEREFVQLLHEGHPVVVAFTLRCNLTKHLDGVLEEAAAEFYPHVKFMRLLAFSAAKENPDYSLPRRNYDAR
ncbi:uncharacterized protein [Malus domestica]|uniref:uncharacterized protein n=1 Tax=Malus domestica TaxID=3750 RepID=UPI0039758BFD